MSSDDVPPPQDVPQPMPVVIQPQPVPAVAVQPAPQADSAVADMTGTLFQDILDKVMKTIKYRKLEVGDLIGVATNAMAIVQTYPALDGATKKKIVVEIVTHIVDATGLLSDANQAAIDGFIRLTLPPMIDAIVGACQGQIGWPKGKGCFPCCK